MLSNSSIVNLQVLSIIVTKNGFVKKDMHGRKMVQNGRENHTFSQCAGHDSRQ